MKKMLVVIALIIGVLIMFSGSDKEYHDVTITVSHGDTLWGIAEEHIGRGEVMDEVLWRIKEKNPGINLGSLEPGTKIIVPVLIEK